MAEKYPYETVRAIAANGCSSAIVLKNSFWQFENHYFKNTDLIECSAIDERSSVDGLKTPKILFVMEQKEFFNRRAAY